MQWGGRGTDEATCLGARPGREETQTAARRPSRPQPRGAPGPSLRGGTAHRPSPPPRQADSPAAGQAAPGARGCRTTPAEQVYLGGMRRRRKGDWAGGHRPAPRRREVGNYGATPPPISPPSPPPARGPQGRRPSTLPRQRGCPPSPRRGRGARGGDAAEPVRHAPPRPHLPAHTGAAIGRETSRMHKDATRTTPGDNTRR